MQKGFILRRGLYNRHGFRKFVKSNDELIKVEGHVPGGIDTEPLSTCRSVELFDNK